LATEIISESVSPGEAVVGETTTFTVLVKGEVASISLTDQLPPASSGGQFTENFTMAMSLASQDGDISTWTLQATANDLGRHRYFATAVKADGTTVQATGEAPTYVVSGASQPPGPSSTISVESFTIGVTNTPIHQGDSISYFAYIFGDAYNVTIFVESLTDPSLNYGVPLTLYGPSGPNYAGTMDWRSTGMIAPAPGDYTIHAYATDSIGGGAQSSFTLSLTVVP
jgi:hypothetical protein